MKAIPLELPGAKDVIEFNRMICEEGKNPHQVLNFDRIEGAIHSSFYGSPPFAHGGVAKLAGALCYFITKGHICRLKQLSKNPKTQNEWVADTSASTIIG